MLMAAEAITNNIDLHIVNPLAVQFYHWYIRTHLVQSFKTNDDAVSDIPFCQKPSGRTRWIQCDQCSRWCNYICVGQTVWKTDEMKMFNWWFCQKL